MHVWLFVLLAGCRIDFDPRFATDATDAAGQVADGRMTDGALIDGAVPFVIEAEAFTSNVPQGIHIWELLTDSPGFRGAGFMQVTPNDNASCATSITTTCSAISYQVTIPTSAAIRVQIRARSFSTDEDSAWYGFDGVVTDVLDVAEDGNWNWTLGPTPIVLGAGAHTLTLWFREAGVRVDQVALTPDATPPP